MDLYIVEPKGMLHVKNLSRFLQQVANRFVLGHLRYGNPHKGKLFLSKLEIELKTYKKTGNYEHLLNVAVYCALEGITPEHPKFHFNGYAKSATR